ncbi:MAG: PmeII family type II restriction endonuclease [Candidatus Nitrotoga sp.]
MKFISNVLKNSFGSMVSGIDIEFVDALDGRKYCQVKLGPNTINRDDVETIHNHFKGARNLGRTNNVKVAHGDLVVAILYGEQGQESGHYKRLRDEYVYPLFIGQEFWHRLTGDENFYAELRQAIAEVAIEARGAILLDETVHQLAATPEIKKLAGQ